MKPEILKLAEECGFDSEDGGVFKFDNFDVEAFYKAAFNAGIEASTKYWIGYAADNYDLLQLDKAIRALEITE